MRYEFKWSMLLDQPYHEWIVDAVLTTLHLALVSWIIALAVGIFIGIARISSSRWLRFLGGAYVELFRNVPLLLQLFLWLYVFPEIMPGEWRQWWYRLDQVPYLTAVIGLSLFTASRIAEQIRSAMLAIPRGQFNAALSTGLSTTQMYRYVIMPYALRIIIPAITSEFLTIFKNTALALTIGVAEITSVARKIEAWSFKGIEAYSVASLTYIVTTLAVILFMNWVEKRAHIPGLIKRDRDGG